MSTRGYIGEPGERLGRWDLRRVLGRGAFGETWLGVDADGHYAAVKLLSAPPGSELHALARVHHPAIPLLLGVGAAPKAYLAMQCMPGKDLADGFPAVPWSPERVCRLSVQLADALSVMHAAGFAHGDVKPSNVLVAGEDEPVASLVDFGLVGAEGGTPAWAAPEVLAGKGASAAADVYSLGLMMRALVLAEQPVSGEDATADLAARAIAPPRAPEGAPIGLSELIVSMLAVEPAARPSAASVVEALESAGYRRPPVRAELVA